MTSPLTNSTTEGRWTPRLWGTLLVLCAAMFLDALDVSMVGVALPSIGSELGLSTSTLQWIVSGYILGYGGLLLLGGRTADLLGRRQVFLVALGVFALASLLGGLVDSGPLLIASRFIKGLSAAFTAPAGLSIITTTFAEGPLRNRALSIYTTCAATGFSMGLVLSGLLTEASWRLTMLLPAPIALIALFAGLKLLRAASARRTTTATTSPAPSSARHRCCCSCSPSYRPRKSAGRPPVRSCRSSPWPSCSPSSSASSSARQVP